MRINDFNKLEERINNQSFSSSYKNINIVMSILSIFGHIASIFLAYFALSSILGAVIENNDIVVMISSIILLIGLELLKRDIFDKFSKQYLRTKLFNIDILPLFISSILVISISFLATINGAKKFSYKESIISEVANSKIEDYSDSLTLLYNNQISLYDNEIYTLKDKMNKKDDEQTELESIQPPTRSAKLRINDLKSEKLIIRQDIEKLEIKSNQTKDELNTKISEYKLKVTDRAELDKSKNSNNSLLFILISSMLEIIILAGVYFNEYYKVRSYKEYRDKLEKDPNYQKWKLYNQLLTIIYTEDTKINQKLPSNKSIIDMCKVNDIIVLNKDVSDFMKIMTNLGIIKASGSTRYINKMRDISMDLLNKHFNIK